MKKPLTRGVPKYCAAFGDTKDDMRATARGLPAITKLVPTGGSPTCCKKKMGKNLMVMPDAKPNMRSAVARMYGMTLVLRLPLLAGLIPFSAIKQWSLQLNVYAGNTYKCRTLAGRVCRGKMPSQQGRATAVSMQAFKTKAKEL